MRHVTMATCALLFALAATAPANAQTGRDLFQQALVKERAEGDLKGAIALYERIVTDFTTDRSLTASALVQLGECYEKLGSAQARAAYQRVVSEFADQTDFVAQARSRLAVLQSEVETADGPVAKRVLDDPESEMVAEMFPSPDGRRVAFISYMDGSVNVRDMDTGKVEKVASGEPDFWNYWPVWSPDGRRLAYQEESQKTDVTLVKIIDVATHRASILPAKVDGTLGALEWARDGRHLLCDIRESSWGAVKAYALVGTEDGKVTMLAENHFESGASLSPDGRFLTYASGEKGDAHVFVRPVHGIWVVPVTDGDASAPPRMVHNADGLELRAWTDAGLFFVVLNNGNRTVVPYSVSVDPATGGLGSEGVRVLSIPHPDAFFEFNWSPDMQRTVWTVREAEWDTPAKVAVYSGKRGSLETFDIGARGYPFRASWSDDGEIIVQVHPPHWDFTAAVIALDPATGRSRTLFTPAPHEHSFSFSRDGSRMAFLRQEDPSGAFAARTGALMVAGATPLDDPRVLAPSGGPEQGYIGGWPAISPSGDRVAYTRVWYLDKPDEHGNSSRAELWVVSRDGTSARRLASAAQVALPNWDPTGRFIGFAAMESTAQGSPTLLRVADVRTGSVHEIPLPHVVGGARYPARWSPDGRSIGVIVTTNPVKWEYWVLQGLTEDGGR
jgi:Tol biopolymer transport system component